MKLQFNSVLSNFEKPVDCRCLTLAFEFYNTGAPELIRLAKHTLQWALLFAGDAFVPFWSDGKHSISSQKMQDRLALDWTVEQCIFAMDGYVRTPEITLKKHVRECFKKASERFPSWNAFKEPGNTYIEFWKNTFPNGRSDNKTVEEQMYALFNKPGMKYIDSFQMSELQVMFVSWPYRDKPELFHGKFYISIHAHCLGDALKDVAGQFKSTLKDMANICSHLNGRVMLQPFCDTTGCSPYMLYFGQDPCTDGSHIQEGVRKDEWYETYYMCGVEWANVISPLVRTHIPRVSSEKPHNNMVLEEFDTGALFLGSSKPITDFDVADMIPMKELVYDALCPGRWHYSIRELFSHCDDPFFTKSFPRNRWEYVPILEGELYTLYTDLVISHRIEDKLIIKSQARN